MRLDVAASEHGVSPAGLGDRTLAVGGHAGVSVRDLLAEASTTETPDDDLRRAIRSASHAFDGCEDSGSLVAVEELRVCGEERSVSGPAGGACHALDDACGRGFFDDDQGCCALRPRAAGVHCAEGAGRCDGNGACVPDEDAAELRLPEGADPALGLPSWVDHTSAEAPSVWLTDHGMQLGLGDHSVLSLTAPEGTALPYDAVHLLATPDEGWAAGVVIDVPGVTRTLHLSPRPIAAGALQDLNTRDASVVEREDAGAGDIPAPLRVVAVLQSTGDLSSAFGDVGAPGRVELTCPGEASGIRCELSGGGVSVTGRDLAFASLVNGAPQHIVPTAFYGVCLFPPCSPPPPVCSYGQAQGCTAPCGKSGLRYCTWNGSWGPCHAYAWNTNPEVCNGIDDDCDGLVDENGAMICADGLTCNVDSCNSQPTWHWVAGGIYGSWAPPSGTCRHVVAPSCADSHTCATPICSATYPTSSVAGQRIATIDAANNCYEVLDSNYCTNTWDNCNCNGPETCSPTPTGDPSGCVMSPGSAAPCEAGDGRKPDDQGLNASQIDPYHTVHHPGGACTIEACIEDSPTCNWAHIGLGDAEDLRLARIGWEAARTSGNQHPGTAYTQPDGTMVHVQCPDIQIWGHKTYLEPGCDDNNSCTDDWCDPSLGPLVPGGCVYRPSRSGLTCDPRLTRNHVANGGSELACGIPNFVCSSTGDCSPHNPATMRPANCTPVRVTAPSSVPISPFYRRNTFTQDSVNHRWNYEYGTTAPHRPGIPSCHSASCTSGGACTFSPVYGLDQRACSAGHGCIVDPCTTATDIMDSNGVIGCDEHPTDGNCPSPGPGDCRIRPVGACQPDGSCILLPNDSKCASRLSPSNECLVATCQTAGSCAITEDTNLCDFGCPPGQAGSQPTCERHTSASGEYGLCRSLGCTDFN